MQNIGVGTITKLQQVSQWASFFVADNVGFINEYFGIKNSKYKVLSESTQVVAGSNHFLELKGSTDKNNYQLTVYIPINNGVPEITGLRPLIQNDQINLLGGIYLNQQVSTSSKDFVASNVGQINKGFGVINDDYQVLTEATQAVPGYKYYFTIRGCTDKLLYTILVYSPTKQGEKQITFLSRQSNA